MQCSNNFFTLLLSSHLHLYARNTQTHMRAHTRTSMHTEPHIVHRDKCRQCAEAQMAQSQWRCRAAFDGCEWLISGLTGSDRVTSGGAWQPQAHARAFRRETRWSWNSLDAQQLHSRPHRSPIHSGYLQPLELDGFLSLASTFNGKAVYSRVMGHSVCHSMLLSTQNMPIFICELSPPLSFFGGYKMQLWNHD